MENLLDAHNINYHENEQVARLERIVYVNYKFQIKIANDKRENLSMWFLFTHEHLSLEGQRPCHHLKGEEDHGLKLHKRHDGQNYGTTYWSNAVNYDSSLTK